MKINVRVLKGECFDIEGEPGETVVALKAKITAQRPAIHPQKFVFNGIVLQDSATLGECGLKDGDFLVLIAASKPKVEAAPAPEPAPAAPPSLPAPAAEVPAAAEAQPPQTQQQQQLQQMQQEQTQAMKETIKMMCDMGFPKSDVERCLRAAFGNPDRAVEYLTSGIPPHLMQQASGQPPPAPPQAHAHRPGHGGGAPQMPMMPPAGNATGPLAKLENHPLFPRVRAAVQQDPALLSDLLSKLNQLDPELVPLIAEHQEEFVELLQAPSSVGMPGMPHGGRHHGQGQPAGVPAAPAAGLAPPAAAAPGAAGAQDPAAQLIAAMQQMQQPGAPAAAPPQDAAAQMLAAMQQQMQQQAPAQPPQDPAAQMMAAMQQMQQASGGVPAAAPAPEAPAAGLPQLSAVEAEAVERLQLLGFDKAICLQAYIACEKNEEVAANYLFDAMGDDEN